ncbi:unnamed protein product [Callosobruchus maculatus]|uniref:Uncharacterized protein n=1 Tax=Callosobruchus maculatus TaxID=64391 RepID=A0A653C0K1_CALMS|nr:unnamed protein product [Callosobruchus maculatus]
MATSSSVLYTLLATVWMGLITIMVLAVPSPQSAHGGPQGAIPQSTPPPLPTGGVGGVRRTLSGWREWRRADPTLINSLWRSKMGNGIRKQLVVIGCWLSDNC